MASDDERYPPLLREIYDPPFLLFGRGVERLRAIPIAVVGTRYPTGKAYRACFELSRYLSSKGVCVVSGLARGICGSLSRRRTNGGCFGKRHRYRLSCRKSPAGAENCGKRRRYSLRISAGNGGAQIPFSAAQPHYQRNFSVEHCGTGARKIGGADYGGSGVGTGPGRCCSLRRTGGCLRGRNRPIGRTGGARLGRTAGYRLLAAEV